MYTIDLDGPEGNVFALIGTAKRLARQLDLNISEIVGEMTSRDYENALAVFHHYFGSVVAMERDGETYVPEQ